MRARVEEYRRRVERLAPTGDDYQYEATDEDREEAKRSDHQRGVCQQAGYVRRQRRAAKREE